MKNKLKKHKKRIFFHKYGRQLNKATQILFVIIGIIAFELTNDFICFIYSTSIVYIVSLLKRIK